MNLYILTEHHAYQLYSKFLDSNDLTKLKKEKDFTERMKKQFKNIEKIMSEDSLFNKSRKEQLLRKLIKIEQEDDIINKINQKNYRYVENKNEERLLLYTDIVKELRGVLVGTTNFLFIRDVLSLKEYFNYFPNQEYIDLYPERIKKKEEYFY